MASGDVLIVLPAGMWLGDTDAQLVAGDNPATLDIFVGRAAWRFDDTAEEAIVSQEFGWPSSTTGITAIVHGFMISDATNDIAIDVFVEAKTPNADTLDMETANSWDTANSGTISLSGTTAGDPVTLSIALSNNDSLAKGDSVRFGARRDTDSANDDATGDFVFTSMEIRET